MKSVVVCGSKRYAKEIAAFCKALEKLGVMVFEPDAPLTNPTFMEGPGEFTRVTSDTLMIGVDAMANLIVDHTILREEC